MGGYERLRRKSFDLAHRRGSMETNTSSFRVDRDTRATSAPSRVGKRKQSSIKGDTLRNQKRVKEPVD